MKIGIVGNGMIVRMLLHSIKDTDIECPAMWCRSEEKGQPFLGMNGLSKIYTDYQAFLQDESFDTVYIALPNKQHYAYTKDAILAGKHVIVEKPFVTYTLEAIELFNLAKEHHVHLFEAIMCRYSPNYQAIKENLDQIGNIRIIQSNISQYSSRYDEYLKGNVLPAFDPKFAGGALADLNVYNTHTVVGLVGKPQSQIYLANIGFNGIDTSGVLVLDYGSFKATCTAAKDSQSEGFTIIQGEKGTITIHSRPGIVQNVTLYKLDTKEEITLDVKQDDIPMATEFLRIQEVIDANDTAQMEQWMNDTIAVVKVLEDARKTAGIVFE